MSDEIKIALGPNLFLSAPSYSSMIETLNSELSSWKPYIDQVTLTDKRLMGFFINDTYTIGTILDTYAVYVESVSARRSVGSLTLGNNYNGSRLLMPPSNSVEAEAILASWNNGYKHESMRILIGFFLECGWRIEGQNSNLSLIASTLLYSVRTRSAIDYQKVDRRKISGYLRSIENSTIRAETATKAIEEKDAQQLLHLTEINSTYDTTAERILEKVVEKFNKFHADAERQRGILTQKNDEFAKEREKRVASEVSHLSALRNSLSDDFHDLHALYYKHLQYQRPVRLWDDQSRDHKKKALAAIKYFCVFIGAMCLLIPGLFFFGFGEYVARSFSQISCDPIIGIVCSSQFSFKGPLLIGSILLVASLFLWITRLQYRMYLSERHMELSAKERSAFAQTYLAMRGDETVGVENEAIVLGALFRATQDGIVKDDDAGFDLSVAALIARQLSGNK